MEAPEEPILLRSGRKAPPRYCSAAMWGREIKALTGLISMTMVIIYRIMTTVI